VGPFSIAVYREAPAGSTGVFLTVEDHEQMVQAEMEAGLTESPERLD
jgi:hypothetical protein